MLGIGRKRVWRGAASAWTIAVVLGVSPAALSAQVAKVAASVPPPAPAPGADLDPSAPLDPMPGLGVDWPSLDRQPTAPVVVPTDPISPATTAAPPTAAIADGTAERRYRVELAGLESVDGQIVITSEFRAASTLETDRKRAANAAQIDRRSRADAALLSELLRSRGYYDAAVEPSVEAAGDALVVRLTAQPGEQYRFATVALPGLETAGEDATALRDSFAVKTGDAVSANEVIAAGVALRVALGARGFALAEVGTQDIVVDHQAHTAALSLPVSPGPVQSFGRIRISGSPPFSARHVGLIARFKAGDRFRQDRVDDLRRALVATGLVSSAEVRIVPAADRRSVDLDVHLEPAPFRTVAGELGYGTGEGIRAEASWTHRNFFNPEGALTVRGVAGTQEQSLAVSVRRNNFRARDTVLNLSASAANIDRVAYHARTLQLFAGIERQTNFIWQKKWTYSFGSELTASDERDVDPVTLLPRRRNYFIFALPTSLNYDGSDDLLDPTRGFRLGGRLSPELSAGGGKVGYARVQLDASTYRPLGGRVVAAARVRVANIFGADRNAIAPSRRYYAGGGGSVRGYGYQRLGPRDAAGDPLGGRGLIEFALEARVRLGAFGIVPFLDGGALSTRSLPHVGKWQYGAGLGLRYYSSFGPIRIDVGTPLNRQKGDSRIAVTVSLGQAF